MKINLDKMDVFKFIVCVLIFVFFFCLIFSMQMKSVINMQNKLLEQYIGDKVTNARPTTSTYVPSTSTSNYTNKYNQYE